MAALYLLMAATIRRKQVVYYFMISRPSCFGTHIPSMPVVDSCLQQMPCFYNLKSCEIEGSKVFKNLNSYFCVHITAASHHHKERDLCREQCTEPRAHGSITRTSWTPRMLITDRYHLSRQRSYRGHGKYWPEWVTRGRLLNTFGHSPVPVPLPWPSP